MLFGGFRCDRSSDNLTTNALVIGTFNIEWLGDGINDRIDRNESDYSRIAKLIEQTDADVLGLQEIENDKALVRLITHLKDYDYKIFPGESNQNNAVIFKRNIAIKKAALYYPIATDSGVTRPGLVFYGKKDSFDWISMVVHFKSTSRFDDTPEKRERSYEIRQRQATVLSKWVDSVHQNSTEKDIIILGDLNDNPERKKSRLKILDLNDNISFLTRDFKSCKNETWDLIDHIVISKKAKQRNIRSSTFVFDFYSSLNDFEKSKISDHCPVLTAFDLKLPDDD